jgi:hypothetical protein
LRVNHWRRFGPDIEPVVRLIENSPEDKCQHRRVLRLWLRRYAADHNYHLYKPKSLQAAGVLQILQSRQNKQEPDIFVGIWRRPFGMFSQDRAC